RIRVVKGTLVIAGGGTMSFNWRHLNGSQEGGGAEEEETGGVDGEDGEKSVLSKSVNPFTVVRAWDVDGNRVGKDVDVEGRVDESVGVEGSGLAGNWIPVVVKSRGQDNETRVEDVDLENGSSGTVDGLIVKDWIIPFGNGDLITFALNTSSEIEEKILVRRSSTFATPLWTFTPSHNSPFSTSSPTSPTYQVPSTYFTSTTGQFLTTDYKTTPPTLHLLTESTYRDGFALFSLSSQTGRPISFKKIDLLGSLDASDPGAIFPRVASIDALTIQSNDTAEDKTLYITYSLQTVSGPPPSPITTRPITLRIPLSQNLKITPHRLPPPFTPPLAPNTATTTLVRSQSITGSGRYLVQVLERVGESSAVV
ncbi:hypothetical protein HK097_006356, partial [Rhizophlyctis rosea]